MTNPHNHLSTAMHDLIARGVPLSDITAALHKMAIEVEDLHRRKLDAELNGETDGHS